MDFTRVAHPLPRQPASCSHVSDARPIPIERHAERSIEMGSTNQLCHGNGTSKIAGHHLDEDSKPQCIEADERQCTGGDHCDAP